ncbi:MAG: MFS transporter [Rhodospirillales bacterium]|nr:MFS transporter [Rhodospirillales bacterium]
MEETRIGRSVWLLFGCQAMMFAVTSGQAVMGPLMGQRLAANPALATLPMALQMVSMMAASIPASMIFARLGRRPGFWVATALSVLGSAVYGYGAWRGVFALYCLGAIPAGLAYGIAQQLRFAAAELASPLQRPRVIALVMTGGVVAAALGPEIVKQSAAWVPGHVFVGSYALMAIPPLVAALLLGFARLPPAPRAMAVSVPVAEVLARPTVIVAILAGVIAYASMNIVMASTPLQMTLCGFGVGDSANVIRAHALAMYLPGFVTGRLIGRFGVHKVIGAGGAVVIAAAAVNIALPPSLWGFSLGLVLLGVGWNFMFVGATTLLTSGYAPQERVRVQAVNDFIVFGSVACTALASGAIEAWAGWSVLNAVVIVPVMLALALVGWHFAAHGPRLARQA